MELKRTRKDRNVRFRNQLIFHPIWRVLVPSKLSMMFLWCPISKTFTWTGIRIRLGVKFVLGRFCVQGCCIIYNKKLSPNNRQALKRKDLVAFSNLLFQIKSNTSTSFCLYIHHTTLSMSPSSPSTFHPTLSFTPHLLPHSSSAAFQTPS